MLYLLIVAIIFCVIGIVVNFIEENIFWITILSLCLAWDVVLLIEQLQNL